jgi:hypothetical protein
MVPFHSGPLSLEALRKMLRRIDTEVRVDVDTGTNTIITYTSKRFGGAAPTANSVHYVKFLADIELSRPGAVRCECVV